MEGKNLSRISGMLSFRGLWENLVAVGYLGENSGKTEGPGNR